MRSIAVTRSATVIVCTAHSPRQSSTFPISGSQIVFHGHLRSCVLKPPPSGSAFLFEFCPFPDGRLANSPDRGQPRNPFALLAGKRPFRERPLVPVPVPCPRSLPHPLR